MLDVVSIYTRVLRAAKDGKGLRLSAEEVFALSRDSAVIHAVETETNSCDACVSGANLPKRFHGLDCPKRGGK